MKPWFAKERIRREIVRSMDCPPAATVLRPRNNWKQHVAKNQRKIFRMVIARVCGQSWSTNRISSRARHCFCTPDNPIHSHTRAGYWYMYKCRRTLAGSSEMARLPLRKYVFSNYMLSPVLLGRMDHGFRIKKLKILGKLKKTDPPSPHPWKIKNTSGLEYEGIVHQLVSGWLSGWLSCCLAGCLAGCLADWPSGWLCGCLLVNFLNADIMVHPTQQH